MLRSSPIGEGKRRAPLEVRAPGTSGGNHCSHGKMRLCAGVLVCIRRRRGRKAGGISGTRRKMQTTRSVNAKADRDAKMHRNRKGGGGEPRSDRATA